MRFVLAILVVLATLYFVFRSGPIDGEKRKSAEMGHAVEAPERIARKNYLKSPIDRTKAVVGKVRAIRSDSEF